MKDIHEMTRLELETEVFNSRAKIQELESRIIQKDYIIRVYGEYIEEHKEKKLVLKKDWYD